MRNPNLVFAIAAAVAKRTGRFVSVMQSERFTEWRIDDVGFAVGPHPNNYPPRPLMETIVAYFNKHVPREKDGNSNKRSHVQ